MEQDLLCQVDRAVLGVLIYLPDGLSIHPQAEELQAPQQENQDNDGGVSGYGNAPDQLLQNDDQKIDERGSGSQKTQVSGGSQGSRGEADDAINGIAEQLFKGPFGGTCGPLTGGVGDEAGFISHPGKDPLGTSVVFRQRQDAFCNLPAEGAEMARVILRRLKFDNETIKRVCLLVRYHDDRPAVTPRNVRRAISRIGVENMEALFAVKRADTLAQSMYERQKKLSYIDAYEETYREILKEHQCVQKKDLAINGRDLIAQGMKTGKEMGEVLQALYEQVLDEPQLNNKETLLALALQLQQTKQE